jgi:hypothetical protein
LECESDDDKGEEEEPVTEKKRKHVVSEYVLVRQWVTGDRAVLPDYDIELELFEEAWKLMHLSGLKNISKLGGG